MSAESHFAAHREGIERVVERLLEKEQITGAEFVAVFEGREYNESSEEVNGSLQDNKADVNAAEAETTNK